MTAYLDKTTSLPPFSKRIICEQATEYPHSGQYNQLAVAGSYLCRRCGLALFRANQQFSSGCGWPAFDDCINQRVRELPDPDGRRTEIRCERCDAHLGHVFRGEHLTTKNRRHCVNSAALDFVSDTAVMDTEEAIVAGGCFWGVDYFLRQLPGVLQVESGYIGGHLLKPTYQQVCEGNSGHYEAVRVIFDAQQTDYSVIIKRFFEIHDPTQLAGQGPDLGAQYQSAIFYYDEQQRLAASTLMTHLKERGYQVVTRLLPVKPFWAAEAYHQNYYGKQGKIPYCHRPESRFG